MEARRAGVGCRARSGGPLRGGRRPAETKAAQNSNINVASPVVASRMNLTTARGAGVIEDAIACEHGILTGPSANSSRGNIRWGMIEQEATTVAPTVKLCESLAAMTGATSAHTMKAARAATDNRIRFHHCWQCFNLSIVYKRLLEVQGRLGNIWLEGDKRSPLGGSIKFWPESRLNSDRFS